LSTAQQFRDPLVGRVIDDRYEILARIGEGGMGVVYKARQTSIDRMVAIKMLNQQMAQDPNWVQRFYNEAKACSQLQHPNTIRMFEFGQTRDGQLFMAMEFLDGQSLRDAIAQGPMHPARVIEILIQCCASLAEAHAIGIIHRDIKPDNVFLLSMPGSPDFVKVLDFSVAKLLQDNERMRTQAGVVFGTPQYMSPEQGRGLPLDARSDLYALGILAYEMLTGQVPFNHENPMLVLQMHMRQPLPPLPAHVPPAVQTAVSRALEKDPNSRFQSAGDMMQHCQQIVAQLGVGGRQMGGPQMGGPHQMGGPQMGGPQMGGPHQMGGPQMGGPQMGGPPRAAFGLTSGAEARTMIAGAPIDVQAMLRSQSGAADKTMIAGGGAQLPDLSRLGAGNAPSTGSGPSMGSGPYQQAQGFGAAAEESGPPKTIMLQDTEGIISLAKQPNPSAAMAAAQPGPMSPPTSQVDLDEDEGAGLLYWVVSLSGGLIVGVLAYLVIRLVS
jgi:tRNA A-37 threonylcarbamoyl transferase component Bud32